MATPAVSPRARTVAASATVLVRNLRNGSPFRRPGWGRLLWRRRLGADSLDRKERFGANQKTSANESVRDEQDFPGDAALVRPPLRRGGGCARSPLRPVGTRRALRPLRPRGLRNRAADPARREARGGRRAGGVPCGLAKRRPLHAGTGEGEHMAPALRAPPRRRSRATRGSASCRAPRRGGRAGSRRVGGGGCVASLRARARAGSVEPASRPAARGARACLLRRLQPVRARRETRTTRRYDQEQDVQRPGAATRVAGRAWA